MWVGPRQDMVSVVELSATGRTGNGPTGSGKGSGEVWQVPEGRYHLCRGDSGEQAAVHYELDG